MQRDPQHVAALLAFSINGMRPFQTSQDDLAAISLEQAHALATVLGSAYGENEALSSANADLQRRCWDGVATLIAMSEFARNGGNA